MEDTDQELDQAAEEYAYHQAELRRREALDKDYE